MIGAILLAGNSRPLEDLIEDQLTYISKLEGSGETVKKSLDEQLPLIEKIRKGEFDKSTPGAELPLGMDGAYWNSLKQYDQITTAKDLGKQIFII